MNTCFTRAHRAAPVVAPLYIAGLLHSLFFAAEGGREEGKIIGGIAPEPQSKGLPCRVPPDPVSFVNSLSTL
jgi:hypothetical protein